MQNDLAGLLAAVADAHSEHGVVKSALEKYEQVLTGHTLKAVSFTEVVVELLLEKTVISLDFLLLTKLHAVLSLFLSGGAVLTGSNRSALKRALIAHAALTLKKELGTFSAAHLAGRANISSHSLDPPLMCFHQTRRRLGGRQPL